MKNQTFGIELEMNGILRTKAAAVIAAHFGTTPSVPDHGCYRTQTICMPDGRVWKVMRDSSIPGPDDEKTEVVSPICRWEDIETVQALVRALRKAGAKTAPAHCGIHVHIGLGSHTPRTLRNLVNIINAKEDLLTQALAIDPERRACWCRPVDQVFLTRMNLTKPQTMEALAKLWYDSSDWQWHASQHYDGSRYRLLNLHAVWQKGTMHLLPGLRYLLLHNHPGPPEIVQSGCDPLLECIPFLRLLLWLSLLVLYHIFYFSTASPVVFGQSARGNL